MALSLAALLSSLVLLSCSGSGYFLAEDPCSAELAWERGYKDGQLGQAGRGARWCSGRKKKQAAQAYNRGFSQGQSQGKKD